MCRNIEILDNTLREGEQAPGVCFAWADKLALFDALQEAGVDRIDIGIPATSEEDAYFCSECVRRAHSARPGATIRALPRELDLAHRLGVRDVYLMFPFSEIHIEHKFGTTTTAIKQRCRELLAHAARLGLSVHLVGEDASRGSTELVCELADAAAAAGIESLYLCDTVGASRPDVFGRLVSAVRTTLGMRCQLGVHCHNDFGLATANTLAGIEAGADIASVTVNGLGERAGNASLHEVAAALPLLHEIHHGVDLTQLPALTEKVESISGAWLSPLTPIVGRNAFRHESGIHVNGLLKQARIYEELQPGLFGRSRELVLGKSAGISHLRALLAEREIDSDDDLLRAIQRRIQQETRSRDSAARNRVRETLDAYYAEHHGFPMERFWAIVEEELDPAHDRALR